MNKNTFNKIYRKYFNQMRISTQKIKQKKYNNFRTETIEEYKNY